MRGMGETYGMGAGASVKKGKTAKQVRRARKAIDAKKKTATSTTKTVTSKDRNAKTYSQMSKNYSVGMTSAKARQVTPGKPKNYRRSQ